MKRVLQLLMGVLLITIALYLIFVPTLIDDSEESSGSTASVPSSTDANASSGGDGDGAPASERENSENSTNQPIGSTQTTTQIPLDLPAGATAEENAAILTAWLQEQGWLGEQDELVELVSSGAVGSVDVERVRQFYNGLPVYASNLVVLRRDNVLIELDGAVAVDINLDVEPTVSIEDAWETANASVSFSVVAAVPEALQVHTRLGETQLVWIFTGGDMRGRTDVLVDAHRNEVVRKVATGAI
jgi:Zn-dependent metalloprotease